MKQPTLVSVVIIFTFFTLFAFREIQDNNKNNGAIGDVKYSILRPEQFRTENGAGWILMNGGVTIETDSLYKISKLHSYISSLPDARGIFIRGMNEGREKTTGDGDGDRIVGNIQSDGFKEHDHGGGDHVHTWTGQYGGGSVTIDSWGNNMVIGGNNSGDRSTPPSGNIIKKEGVSETRPRNIALYIYIKIN